MKHNIIWWINCVFLALIAIFLGGGLFLHANRNELSQPSVSFHKQNLPESSFTPNDKNYEPLGVNSLLLEYQQPKMRLPDLRPLLQYHGHNMRPDAKDADSLFFSIGPITDTNPSFSIKSKEKIYLISQQNPVQPFALSPGNRPSSLWIEAENKGPIAHIKTQMKDDRGNIIVEPVDRANFTLTEKPVSAQSKGFMIDQFRADPTLLSRQKARWKGRDLFLEDHGGEEFEKNIGKQRIQFDEGEDSYSIYLSKDDVMIWKDGRWIVPEPGMKTNSFPLARVNKLEERVIALELFDITGKNKVALNLLKVQETNPNLLSINRDFHFIGARTKIHSMFKISNDREIVGPDDWFLQTSDGWKKLKTAKEVDAYVSGLTPGSLLVIDRIVKQNEDQWLHATLFNRSRSAKEEVLLPLKPHPTEKDIPQTLNEGNAMPALEASPVDLRLIPRG